MSTDKRQFTLRIQDETYEKMRYLAFIERRSMAMEIETAMLAYISAYEKEHGAIQVPDPFEWAYAVEQMSLLPVIRCTRRLFL